MEIRPGPSKAPFRASGIKLCDPGAQTPPTSNTLVVKNIGLNIAPRIIVDLFSKYGRIIDQKFPNVNSQSESKYCFLKYENARQARDTCQHYNDYLLLGRRLEVAHFDLAKKYLNNNIASNIEESEDNVVGYVRQAQLQAEHRAMKQIIKKNCLTRFTDGSGSATSASPILANANDFCLDDAVGETEVEEDEDNVKKRWKCVDDVGLETVTSFWEWLRAKLTFTGPIHYTHPDISKAIHKLPPSAQREFSWLLGAFRAASNVGLIGPFVSLKEHTYWAKEMCVVARLDYKVPFKEVWEPMHPSDINNERQLIKFVRAMLINFGPLSTTDHRIFLLIACLNEGMRVGQASSPDGLCRLLETDSHFIVNKDIYYLSREHEFFLGRARVNEWRTDDVNASVYKKVNCADSGCGSSVNSSE